MHEREVLIEAGAQLSNIAFNLAQQVGQPLPERAAQSMKECQRAWDVAVVRYRAALASAPAIEPVSPMAKMAQALRDKAAAEKASFDTRVQSGEWGPAPDAGTEADCQLEHVAQVEGDAVVRTLRWNKNVGAFEYPVGTKLYAASAPLASAPAAPDAHEVWAAAQLVPGEGIEDGVARIEAMLGAASAPAATEVEWDGKLPDSLERSLNSLRLEVTPDVASDHDYAVRQAFKAICTDRATLRHLYKAMQAKVPVSEGGTASHPQAQVVELPPPRRYWWSPARLAPFVPTWSDNCGPHPDWIVTPYYSADEVRAILDARQEPERPPPWKQYSDELTAREVAQVRKAFEGKT